VDPDDAPELTKGAEVHHGGTLVGRAEAGGNGMQEVVSLPLDQDLVAALRALGPGWQARMNAALRAFVGQTRKV
jgi:uncharacterized protein (DUF4415 family)